MPQTMQVQIPGPTLTEFTSAVLYHMKKGIKVTNIRVWLTHENIHYIWYIDSKTSRRMRQRYPFSLSLPKLGEPPEVIDCRKFTALWNVSAQPFKAVLSSALEAILKAPDPKQYLAEHPELIAEVQQAANQDPEIRAVFQDVLGSPQSHPSRQSHGR